MITLATMETKSVHHIEANGVRFGYLSEGMFGAIPPSDKYREAQKAMALPTPQPTLYLHGVDDECMGIELAEGAEKAFPHPASQVVRIEDAGHFLHLERPHYVNERIIEFLRGGA